MNKESALSKKIVLPELGEGVTEGELVKWLVSEGDLVQIDQAVAEVMTDKASMEIPSPLDGVVESVLAKEGDTIQVGQNLLTIKLSAEKAEVKISKQPASPVLRAIHPVKAPVPDPKDPKMDTDSVSSVDSSVLATPFTRRLARELGVNLNQIQGSGLAGRITKQDVLKYSDKSAQRTPVSGSASIATGFSVSKEDHQDRQPLKGIRKKIAEKMQLSKTIIPHFTLLESADVEQLEELKNSVKDMLKEKEIKVTYLSFVMKALLQTIKEFPELNASIDDFSKEIVIKNYYHFGFAVDTPRGLLVPVVKNVDKKSVAEVSFEIQTLAEKARAGNIQVEDMSEGTITITNIGSLGGQYATPIINAPEVAILGMYRLYIRPYWDGSSFIPKKTMNFSLTCDHRLIDGAVSARVMKSFIQKIENPLSLFI